MATTTMFSSRAFLTKFHEFSRRRRIIEERDKIVAAVSGGVDSIVLLDLLAKEQEAFGLTLIVAHFNFQLRGDESDEDEQFVAQRARHYALEFYVERANTEEYARFKKIGIQEAARDLRYEFFDKLLMSSGFDKIATAHNANDNVETIMFNMFRGAGVSGLAGIPVFREDRRIIRPLLFAQRSEIETYAAAEHLAYREDSSNAKDCYTRNYIRQHILPLVKEKVNPDVVATMSRSAEVFRELEAYLRQTAKEHYQGIVVNDNTIELQLSIPRLRSNPQLLQQYIVMLAAETFAGCKLEYDQVQNILGLTEGLSGSWIALNKDYVAFRNRDHLVFRRGEEIPDFRFAVIPNHRYWFPTFSFASEIVELKGLSMNGGNVEYVDADRIAGEDLILRSWQDGDAFVPLGMKSKKKVSDFFVDAKIPLYEKRKVPILETRKGDIVWVCGCRIDDRFKVTSETRSVMKLEYILVNQSNGKEGNQDQR
ncbi:MAG: tRNA lysidine(34) synthetase TilS [Ignavibacteriae bacterium]|nr:tRNA lysidine(34) synthetase TilS [Ignavibacteriota bacterium]